MKRSYRWNLEEHRLEEIVPREIEGRVHIIPDIQPYVDDQMDHAPVYVKSRQHKRLLLKERGLAIL